MNCGRMSWSGRSIGSPGLQAQSEPRDETKQIVEIALVSSKRILTRKRKSPLSVIQISRPRRGARHSGSL